MTTQSTAAALASLNNKIQKTPPAQEVAAPEFAVFLNALGSSAMVPPKGARINFVGGKFVTKNAAEIEFLRGEIAAGNTFLSEGSVTDALIIASEDPVGELRRKFYQEFLEAQESLNKKLAEGNTDMGSTESKLSPANSQTVKVVSAGN